MTRESSLKRISDCEGSSSNDKANTALKSLNDRALRELSTTLKLFSQGLPLVLWFDNSTSPTELLCSKFEANILI